MAPFEGRHLKFIIPVATSLDSFRFRMSLNTVSTLTTASLPVTTNSLTRGKAQSSVGLSSQSLDTPAGCVGGIYAGNKFVASMEVLNTAQYSSSKTVVYLELEASSPYTLPNGAPQITLQKADGAFSGSFCTDADGKQLNWVCAVPSGGFVSGNSKDKAIVSLNGKVDAAASGIMDEFVRFIIRVGTSTSQKPGAILPVEQEIEFPLCVQSNFQQTFKIEEKTTPRSMPDNSMIYPHANLALYRTLLLINTGPSHKATDFYTNIAIDTDNESWGDTLPAGCVQQSESIVHCTTGPMKANDPSDFAYWRLPTVLKHANVITSKVATTTAQATPEGGTTSFASFGIYYGVDISLSANGITDIPLGSKATFILATTNRHPSTDATDLNITWAFPANLELQYDELAFSGYTVNPVCETFMSNDTNSDNLIPMLTCIGTQPAGSSTRVRIPATAKNANAETDVAAVGLVATARVLSMNEPDTPADRLTRAKSVTWNFATTSFANVEVTLIPDYSVVDPDTGVHMFALDQTVQMQATIRDIGSLATTGLVATLEWDDNMRLRSNTKRKCATGAVTTNTTWTCDYRSIDQTDRFLENSFTFDYFVDPAVNDTFEVYWRVQSDNDRIPINDGASIDGQISEPVVDLKVSAQINPKTLLPNQPFTMTILCQNQGPSAAANVTLETSNWPSLWMDMIQIPEDCTVVNSQIECDMPILVRGGASVSYTFNGTSKPEIANELNDFVERTVWKLNEGTIASNGDFKNRALYFIYTNFQPKETEVPNNSKTTNTIAAVAGATAIYLAASGIFMLYHAHFFARHPPPETFVEPDVGEL
ncbi:hypothetical protein SARC_06319 [Sphaeroforma arctica JP610]|uniref:DUF11 domain-containing protein n=1 Tax=Sphaeroforma arctica JP610 TaxID=667725 RepID=A0A0L0FXI8_9EUKA|nr:hypothetical protein SARC_06319 [Sphaeroforma arctica JP610]KNC81359.1 hypothetical protein SARC_06319 [Sphaeroforma arctica JP610]|eukprot:XP_014155261.1 hypothetical protein SARC_06319 [Sphaeroforma arctica JP610]